ncbi:MAG: ABC-2 family transporter protein [Candidatus Enteromonas sp.]|nr:ABC-2 family transporter protein [Candidatus Enteromonas sp.]
MIRKYFKLYPHYLAMAVKSKLIYRLDAALGIIGFFFSNGATFLSLYLALSSIGGLGKWSFMHIIFLYGFLMIPMGIDHMLTDRLWNYGGWLIHNGELDRILMKPLNPLFQMCAEFFQEGGIGEIVLGVAFIAISAPNISVTISFSSVMALIVGGFFSIFIYFAIKLGSMSVAFYTHRSISLMSALYNVKDFGRYPGSIYHSSPKKVIGNVFYNILLFLLPFGLVGYLPVSCILFPGDPIPFLWFSIPPSSWLVAGIIAVVAIAHFSFAYWLFRRGIRRYGSAGS